MARNVSDEVWTAEDLLGRLQRRDRFFVFDVRGREAFERSRLEGPAPLPGVNVPFSEMVEAGGQPEKLDSILTYLQGPHAPSLPADLPILAVCAKGKTSAITAQALRQLGFASHTLEGGMAAWSEYYAIRVVAEEPNLSMWQLSRPARGCLSYVVASEGRAVVVDALRHLHPYLELLREHGLTVEAVMDTHAHADHISGGPALAEQTKAPYYLHPYDGIHPIDLVPAAIPYRYLSDGERFSVGSYTLEALHVPGHTLGMVALRLGDRYLFTGDSIFIESIGRPDLGGKAEQWSSLHSRSLRRLLELPGGLTVLPGHFSNLAEADEHGLFAASLDSLRKHNSGLLALQQKSEGGFARYLLDSLPRFMPEYPDIKRVNAGLLSPSEEKAATLETGRNVCALSQAYGANPEPRSSPDS